MNKLVVLFHIAFVSPFANAVVNGAISGPYFFARTPMVQLNLSAGGNCSGVLVSSRTILTAAHCLVPNKKIKSILAYIPQGPENSNGYIGVFLKVKNHFIHPEFSAAQTSFETYAATAKHDLAVIQLQEKAPSSKPIAVLTQVKASVSYQPKESIFLIAGYGTTTTGISNPYPSWGFSRIANLAEIIDERSGLLVKDIFQIDSQNDGFVIDGKLGASACYGDSGGGLFYLPLGQFDLKSPPQFPKKWELIGITSWVLDTPNTSKTCGLGSVHAGTAAFKNSQFIKRYFIP